MSIWSRGASGNKTLTRGNPGETRMLAEHFQDKDGEARAGVYTIQFSTRPVNGAVPASQNPTSTLATITWTIGGNQIRRQVSVANGQSITGVGAGCTVVVEDTTFVRPSFPDPIPDYVVTATLTPGSRGSSGNPPTYFPANHTTLPSGAQHPENPASGHLGLAGGINDTAALFEIPMDAGAISVQVTIGTDNNDVANVTISQLNAAGSQLKTYNNSNYVGFVPLDPQAVAVQITNESTTVQPYFGLCFGIDG